MLKLREDNPLDMLRQFSVHFDGDLIEHLGAAKMSIDNNHGKGYVSLYELIPGLTAWTYNIELAEDLVINMEFSKDKPFYFGYNVSGCQLQKFPHESKHKKIRQGQNFIIISEPNTSTEFIIPKNVLYKCCYIIINSRLLLESNIQSKIKLLHDLEENFNFAEDERPYRYFGDIDARIGTYASIIVENKRTDIVGRLITEGSVLRMLGSQIEAHQHDCNTENYRPTLTKSELSRITGTGDHVLEHISEKITIDDIGRHLRISPKKLQAGIRFLYGYSANEYLTKIRLEHSRELMHSTEMNISEICFAVGYQSKSYFSKIFSDTFGTSPSTYRKKYEDANLLFDISYRSLAIDTISGTDVDEIISLARLKNPQFEITGSIIFHRNIFFQIIEGPKKHVLALFDNICKDTRHKNIQVMWKGFKIRREFDDWALATLGDEGELEVQIQGNTKNLELGNLLGELDNSAIDSENLWRKVRNIIKVNANDSAA
ncbi:BLUF domain-containing protein [Zobellia galactanivorans]|uniref:BLUF domain-containing protein n=1 Tax=Zobellia galactanivorans (strain DSM 12802 / CCUG 47099 / CIP 106680 / NCIMB 13871 / Dsij) TaxID=63186 RepID=UPI001C07DEE5|nr:BLUF domain-containing protein [Zobellia galactanivorans]MBU3025225.1 BLUF domain-containing protein [Zobellia galactanivorans]MDO6810953.1 BLUF domain-containing protein [Zobellia galactanivorans]